MKSISGTVCLLLILLTVGGRTSLAQANQEQPSAGEPWVDDWSVEEGLSLSIDVSGFDFPTSIVFVPNPGKGPKDPLYFVAELRGALKAVTNDRSIVVVVEDLVNFVPEEELPSYSGESGFAGMCLDAGRGYLFAAYSYHDADKILRNQIARIEFPPNRFGTAPLRTTIFAKPLAPFRSSVAHQIGACEVVGNNVFVGVGDAFQPQDAQNIDHASGKVLRMTVDGQPARDNPFYTGNGTIRDYVFAYGLRNPFGLRMVNGRLFAAENGPDVDRFLEIKRGHNYLWGQKHLSIAIHSEYMWIPSLGPVNVAWVPRGGPLGEQYDNTFFVALYGNTNDLERQTPGITAITYDSGLTGLSRIPEYVVKSRNEGLLGVTAVAMGPDGLYFASIYPDVHGKSPIYVMKRGTYPHVIGGSLNAMGIIRDKGCIGCHAVGTLRSHGGSVGPDLIPGKQLEQRIRTRLSSPEYANQVATVDQSTTDIHVSYREARHEVLNASEVDKVRVWLRNYLQEPTFDRMSSPMPNLGLSDPEAHAVADYLLTDIELTAFSRLDAIVPNAVQEYLLGFLPINPNRGDVARFFVGGLGLGFGFTLAFAVVFARIRRRRLRRREARQE